MRPVLAMLLVLGLALVVTPARADDDDRAFDAFLAGGTAAVIPMIVGGIRAGSAPTSSQKNAGLVVAAGGLAFAPITAHIAVREYDRAAIFGVIPVLSAASLGALTIAKPDAVFDGTVASRATFAVLFTACVFGSVLGVVDAMAVGDRKKSSAPSATLSVYPGGLSMRGVF
jgi:hypothetical protein